MTLIPWTIRSTFWNIFGWLKVQGNKPVDIPVPTKAARVITPVPLQQVVPSVAVSRVLVCPAEQLPSDENSTKQNIVYKLQVWLYGVFSPMQTGLPPIDADPAKALKTAFTWLHRTNFAPPVLPAEFLGSPDLGALAARGPYAGYTEACGDGIYQWDLAHLASYEVHNGLRPLGATVLFKLNPTRRALEAFQIDCSLGRSHPHDCNWEVAKKLALASATTEMSLVRHWNGVHLIGSSYLAIATRNQLQTDHPLCRLLWPYLFGTQHSNDITTRGQMVPGGEFETIFSFTMSGLGHLFDDSFGAYQFVVNDPEADAKRRQVVDAGFDTPSEDNLKAIFDVLHAHARDFLQIYYRDAPAGSATAALRADATIGAWLDELNTLIPNGVEVTRANLSFDSLARLVARFMYLTTVQHELLGSYVWNYQLWTHRQPVRVYKTGQREPLDVYQRLVNANYNLNVRRRALNHDFSYLFDDLPAKAAQRRFNRALEALQETMEREPWAVWKMYPKSLKANVNA